MRKILAAVAGFGFLALLAREAKLFPLLKSDAWIGKQAGEFYLLPTNQLLRPWGEQAAIKGRPVDLAFDADKRILAVLNSNGVDLFDATSGAELARIATRTTSYTGIAFRPGSRELWVSETREGKPDSLLIETLSAAGPPESAVRIELPGHPVPCGIAFSPNGEKAFVALSRKNAIAAVNARTRQVERRIDAGIAPFGVVYSGRTGKLYVTNRGGRRPSPGDAVAASSGTDVVTDAITGSSSTGTVSVIDTETGGVSEFAVGLQPSAIALNPAQDLLAVANSHSDSVSFIGAASGARTDVAIPTWPKSAAGSIPDALVFSPDGQRLYVAAAGDNAIVALSGGGGNWKVDGAIPVGWFPTGIALDSHGDLRVVNLKGTGNTARREGGYNTRQFEGSLSRIPAPSGETLMAGTREVEAANSPRLAPSGGIENLASLGIEHVFLIVKENRTYDQVFGDMKQGNGDAKYLMYGRDVSPNHHALAEKYVLLDNFYTSGAISFDGHQWLMMGFVSDYTERAFAASPRGYAWNMVDSLTVAPTGFFWQSAPRPVSLRIYGEFCLPATWDPKTQSAADIDEEDELNWSEYYRLWKEGKWESKVGSKSGVPVLAKYFDRRYPNDSLGVPDQIRADEFLREFREFENNGKLPRLVVMTLNNDHTNGVAPGYPTPRAMVADNDLALGRVVEAIAKSRYWASSLVLAVEDDSQNGVDHVDGHRTVALAIGPHIRRGVVDSNLYNQLSMIRTIQEIFGIAPRTRFLASARAMNSLFTANADRSAYAALTPKIPLDEMNPPLKALRGRRLWAARQSRAMNWAGVDRAPAALLNRILWWDAKGYDTPYPVKSGK